MKLNQIVIFTLTILTLSSLLFSGSLRADLKKELEKPENPEVNAIVIYKSQQPLEVENIMKAEGVKVKRGFRLIPGAAISGNKKNMEKLASKDFVYEIQPDYVTSISLDISAPAIGAAKVWKENITGRGIKVAVVDTGIQHHPAFENRITREIDFTSDGTSEDYYGHGTHVAGIIASNDPGYRGVAPAASLMNIKVLNRYGWGYASDVVSGVEWAVSNGADIISMSLGAEFIPCDGSDAMSLAVDNAVSKGAIVVVAAGNSGPDSETINSPGCSKKAITVGAVDDSSSIASFSSKGPTSDGRTKPDIVAPGVAITSTSNSNGFVSYSGTSMATPHVTGTVALLLETDSSLAYEKILSILQQNSTKLSYDANTAGAGKVDAYSAYLTIMPRSVLNETNSTNKTKEFKNLTNRTKVINVPPGFLKNLPRLKGMAPNSSAYGLKRLIEMIKSSINQTADEACMQAIDYAELRLAEMEKLSNKESQFYLDELLSDYEAEMKKCDALLKGRILSNETRIKQQMLVSSSMHKEFLNNLSKRQQNLGFRIQKTINDTDSRDKKLLNELETNSPNFVVEFQLHEAEKKLNANDIEGYKKEMQKVNARIDLLLYKGIDVSGSQRILVENTAYHLEILLSNYEAAEPSAKKDLDGIILATMTTRANAVNSLKQQGVGLGTVKEKIAVEKELNIIPLVAKKNKEENAPGSGSSSVGGGSGQGGNSGNGGGGQGGNSGSSGGGRDSSPGNSGNALGHNK